MRKQAITDNAKKKREIQALLRDIVIIRDKCCQRCGAKYGTPGMVFQCDHLLSRSNSASYAEPRLCTLLCKGCHAWKSLGGNVRQHEYDLLIRSKLPPDRVKLWDACLESRHRPTKQDWTLHIVALKQQLTRMQNEQK